MNLQKGNVDVELVRTPVIINRQPLVLKAIFPGANDMATIISNQIGSGFNIDAAVKEALFQDCYEEFSKTRLLCDFIETSIQRMHKLHYPLVPPMAFEFQGNYWQIRSIEYVPHPESGMLIALLKTYLV